jgi:hypothetical protein
MRADPEQVRHLRHPATSAPIVTPVDVTFAGVIADDGQRGDACSISVSITVVGMPATVRPLTRTVGPSAIPATATAARRYDS